MKFRTELSPSPAPFTLGPSDRPLMLGSCFADYMGARLRRALWPAAVNPCGVMFNPESVAALLDMALSGIDPEPEEHAGRWLCFDLPTRYAASTRAEASARIAAAMDSLRSAVDAAGALIVTFGTARVYRLAATGSVVANCHKLPQSLFRTVMLSPDAIARRWADLTARLRALRPGLKIVYTVSPVRHVRDGLHANTLSKAALHLAVDALTTADPEGSCYFPAYEALTDDLRDYRFYASDLVHPSDMAVDYIHDLFARTFLTPATRDADAEAEALSRRAGHRPITDDAEAITRFEADTRALARDFALRHPERLEIFS